MKTLLLHLAWLILFLATTGRAQSLRFDHLTVEDGLSQSQAYSIFQDSYGYVWIGTQDGLNRFDGHAFRVFKNDPFDSTTLTHNWVWSIEEDNHGDLWIGTYKGVCKYVRGEDRFIQYFHSPSDPTTISGNRTNYIIKDQKGRLWISAWGKGLNLYDEESNSFRRFRHDPFDPESISDNFVRSLFCDSRGQIWAGTWNGGLSRIVETNGKIVFKQYLTESPAFEKWNKINSIVEDDLGNIWIACNDAGLGLIDKSKNTIQSLPGFPKSGANSLLCDKAGNIWVGTNEGLYYLNHQNNTFETYHHDPVDPKSISSNVIYELMEDRNGSVWIAGTGVDRYDPQKNLFETYQNVPGDQTTLSENMVWSFCEDETGEIWIGSESNHVDVFDPETGKFRQVFIRDDKGNMISPVYRMIPSGDLFWIASFGSGLVRYEKKTGKATFFYNNHPSALGNVRLVTELLMDSDQSLWIGTEEDGLLHYFPDRDSVVHYRANPGDPKSLGGNLIKSIHKDSKGNIWLCYTGAGVGMLDIKTNTFTNYRYDRKNTEGLSDQIVISVTQQDDSIFWLTSHGGLNRLNVQTGKFKHFFEKDGLSNNVVYEMLQDADGNYWLSSNGGLCWFNPSTNRFKTYTTEDGLQSNEFNSNAAFKSSSGDFYFGGIHGFSVFKPEKIKAINTPAPLFIESYSIFNTSHLPASSVTLKHDENYITFTYAALEFTAPEKIRYAYQLEGFDKDWVQAGTQREAHYTNLEAGTYTFRVKAANPYGYWTEPGATMSITIQQAFWRTGWFTALLIFFVAVMIYSIHRYRLEQSLKLERLRNKIASDLHDEVGASLSRISIYSDLVQNGVEAQDRRNYLANIGELTREVISTMSDIVWSIDNRHDTVGSLTIRMKDFASEILQARDIDLSFTVRGLNENKVLSPTLKQNIYLIFKEAIHNVTKHANAGRVNVTITNEEGIFTMIIKDNGKGMNGKINQNGNGLRNMKRRASNIGGSFDISQSEGTTLTLKRAPL